ncbi:hypothetical protein [Sphaerotilus mobilis]|uniref:Uncharacterized protein n=1 Tax=Sphaerotilus mobilis TaxID=47994 RepID=A0A4Q7LG52_9BURK|nr:hypothetical protein [Sphaerotilus mobilis]RZS52993.1 hypothetical protein EV685_2615 [Sphaerotilus mobilis]
MLHLDQSVRFVKFRNGQIRLGKMIAFRDTQAPVPEQGTMTARGGISSTPYVKTDGVDPNHAMQSSICARHAIQIWARARVRRMGMNHS